MAHLYVRTTGADVLSGSSQQAGGELRAVEDYPGEDIFWLGVDPNNLKAPCLPTPRDDRWFCLDITISVMLHILL